MDVGFDDKACNLCCFGCGSMLFLCVPSFTSIFGLQPEILRSSPISEFDIDCALGSIVAGDRTFSKPTLPIDQWFLSCLYTWIRTHVCTGNHGSNSHPTGCFLLVGTQCLSDDTTGTTHCRSLGTPRAKSSCKANHSNRSRSCNFYHRMSLDGGMDQIAVTTMDHSFGKVSFLSTEQYSGYLLIPSSELMVL